MTKVKNYLYILVAASAVGKSALMRQMVEEHFWLPVSKYSTRDVRYKDGEVDDVVEIDGIQTKTLSVEDASKVRLNRIARMKELCGENRGVVYYKNGNFYGIEIKEIEKKLCDNNVIAIISDFNIIKRLKCDYRLKDRIKVMYIASTIDERELLKRFKKREAVRFDTNSEDTRKAIKNIQTLCSVLGSATRLNYMDRIEEVMPLLNEEWNTILPYFETIKTRGTNIRMLYNQYIDNIETIDYAILNFYDLDFMFDQTRNIVKRADAPRKVVLPPIFMVCAAPSSGKATLMEIVGDLGEVNGNIRITHKYAKRAPRAKTDGRDGMIAIGENGAFSDYISSSEKIWEWEFHKGADAVGVSYAVDRGEIEKNIEEGIAQIFISNMSQIEFAKKYYPNNIVILYLHATHETETKNHIVEKCKEDILRDIIFEKGCKLDEALEIFNSDDLCSKTLDEEVNKKLAEIKLVHYSFIEHNHQIDHVLLNTGTREDLVLQMTNLINYYVDR